MPKLDLPRLERDGSLSFESTVPPDAPLWEGSDLRFDGDVAVRGRASVSGTGEIVVQAHVEAVEGAGPGRSEADLRGHLEAERPEIGEQFLAFLETEAPGADSLYILGDLFEYWIGDDDPDPYYASMKAAIAGLTRRGVPVYFMHGNRDFLLGADYAARAGMQVLPDPAVVELYGRRVLLTHGDLLCTDDVEYQKIRAQTRSPDWQAHMLAQPLQARLAFAHQARAASQARQGAMKDAGTMETITDASPATVEETLRRFGIDTLIHGHTHRPAIHRFVAGERDCRRIVLGDWYTQGSVLRASGGQFELRSLPPP